MILAVPDKRFCFDYFRPLTTTGQVLEAHAAHRSRHTRQIGFEHFAYVVKNGEHGAWGQTPIEDLTFFNSFAEARDLFSTIREDSDSPYVDMHAWQFVPASFELVMLELARLGETDWGVERITPATGCEFYVWLRRGGKTTAAALSETQLNAQRLELLRRTLLEIREQIDFAFEAREGQTPAIPAISAPQVVVPKPNVYARFEHRAPSDQTAVDVFRGRWASDLSQLLKVNGTGPGPLFTNDGRPDNVAAEFGRNGSLEGMTILEIGPLEGAHTYKLEQLGASSITARKSNIEAWLKCLVVKEMLNLKKSHFLLGDALTYLENTRTRFDVVDVLRCLISSGLTLQLS